MPTPLMQPSSDIETAGVFEPSADSRSSIGQEPSDSSMISGIALTIVEVARLARWFDTISHYHGYLARNTSETSQVACPRMFITGQDQAHSFDQARQPDQTNGNKVANIRQE